MRPADRIFGRVCLVLSMGVLCGCVAARAQVQEDPPWTEQDQKALKALAAAWKEKPPPVPELAAKTAPPKVAASASTAGPLLKIHVFNIGQADSMLVIGPAPEHKTLLIDLGKPSSKYKLPSGFTKSDSSAKHVLRRIEDLTKRSWVDYFVLSHYHGDHAGDRDSGIIGLLWDDSVAFAVGEFIHVGDDGAEYMATTTNDRYVYTAIRNSMAAWVEAKRVGISSQPRFGSDQIRLGSGVTVEILAFAGKVPSGSKFKSVFETAAKKQADYTEWPANENDLSIALQISAGEFELFTAGDLTGTADPDEWPYYQKRIFNKGKKNEKQETWTNIEHPLVRSGRLSDVEIYRANHHGSGYSTTRKLLDALDPEFILYSTGAGHFHPDNDVVERGAKTARQFATTAVTDSTVFKESGEVVGEIEIEVATDGKSYTIHGEKHLAFTAKEEKQGKDKGEEDKKH